MSLQKKKWYKKWYIIVPLVLFWLPIIIFFGLVIYLVVVPPCSRALTYTLGVIDKRFELTNQKILEELSEAESVWEKSSKYNLFEYEPRKDKADISIDFVYDDRQETLVTSRELDTEITQYEKTIAAYESRLDRYEEQANQYDEDTEQYEIDLERWNSGNRRSETEYRRLRAEDERLRTQYTYLKQETTLLEEVQEKLEPVRIALNERINELGGTDGDIVEDGRWDPREDKITVYRYEGDRELKWLLAHELGHALGMEHVDYPRSVMHYLSSDVPIITLSHDDVRELSRVCWE